MEQNAEFNLKYTENYYGDLFGKLTLELKDNSLSLHYKNLAREFTKEYEYKNINPQYTRFKSGRSYWSNYCWGLLFIILIFDSIAKIVHLNNLIHLIILVPLLLLLVLSLILRFRKHEGLSFYDIYDNYLFGFDIGKKIPKAQEFVDELLKRIEKARKQQV